MMDIDLFKYVNDTYGHEAGDFVLKELANLFKDQIRETDVIARIGGEEFLLILQNTDLDGAKKLAEKIRAVVENKNLNPDEKENTPNKITISAGVSTFTKGSKKINLETDLLISADQAMYYAKKAGRNRVWVTDESILNNGKIGFDFHDALIERKKLSKLQVLLNKLRRK
ncbi:MAG: Diguanylate cyclase [Candidatus Roizmanbacteria bacterium GW2011_GWA2_33_33]|nr:MAG: Diguanylate cyclase [Candidatus Roizmanbacteria bacterium GW2011_GWA2_33_33]